MAESLFDQLKKAGLVDAQKAQKAQKAKGKAQYQQVKQNTSANHEVAEHAAQALAQKAERDRALNQAREAIQAQKAREVQARQLIESNRLSAVDGAMAYHFSDNGCVKTLYVNAETHHKLASARIRIARFDGGYALISAAAAEKLASRAAALLIARPNEAPPTPPADDYYAQFTVPDDLNW
ncbi:MAG: hypothetical protein B7X12_03545 [Halothiobacillus sp. 20-53-49]|nr:DUF2058 domain-containing protein [Halothiobacillaceae bacterium]OYV46857.1 MAG: hypothetical protein B7X12_03545 [Halothiobacillus sp. 20-53-49]OYY54747.1 MAG: hypothetical protein B7Y53_05410 [Halothiobacillus sp. 28-55-5]HUM99073.1 DUF2058 domain-containing protein [Halothiobacillus sp.]